MAKPPPEGLTTLAVTTGDPAGIGPEICVDAGTATLGADPGLRLRVYGDAALFPASFVKHPQVTFCQRPCAVSAHPGKPDAANGPYVMGLIADAVADIQAGAAQGLVTAPIAKTVLYKAGFAFPGHTEFLGHLAGGGATYMMLASTELRVVPVTLHQSLASAIGDLTSAKIIAAAQATNAALKDWFALAAPRLVICGLNPHAGEQGYLGHEDEAIVRPAVEALRAQGIDIRGPLPADTLFHAAARRNYDCALGLYHDQVMIPIKALTFESAVNLTLGLPFVRTSPDHGTAFDIAGRGQAEASSIRAAIELAAQLSRQQGP